MVVKFVSKIVLDYMETLNLVQPHRSFQAIIYTAMIIIIYLEMDVRIVQLMPAIKAHLRPFTSNIILHTTNPQ